MYLKLTLGLLLGLTVSSMAQDFKSDYFEVAISGQGTPMLMVPGLSSSGEVWNETAEHFSTNYECHQFTLAGFAGVAPLQEEEFLPHIKKALIEYIETLDQPVILIGHSLGGFLTYSIGSERPDLLIAAISVDGAPNTAMYMLPGQSGDQLLASAQAMKQGMVNQPHDQFVAYQPTIFKSMIKDQELAEACSEWGKTSDQATVGQAMYELLTNNLTDDLKNMKVPTLQMSAWVSYKRFGTTREIAEQMIKAQTVNHPNLTLAINDDAYHFIMLDEPEWFIQEIETFLTKN